MYAILAGSCLLKDDESSSGTKSFFNKCITMYCTLTVCVLFGFDKLSISIVELTSQYFCA